jgi:hypothetical protein
MRRFRTINSSGNPAGSRRANERTQAKKRCEVAQIPSYHGTFPGVSHLPALAPHHASAPSSLSAFRLSINPPQISHTVRSFKPDMSGCLEISPPLIYCRSSSAG